MVLAGRLLPVGLVVAFCGMFLYNVRELPPSAATYPRILSVAVAVIALLAGAREVHDWHRQRDDPTAMSRGLSWRQRLNAASVVAAITFLIVGMRRLGFYETATLFLTGLFLVLGVRKPWLLVPLVVEVITTLYVLLTIVFRVPLPRGLLIE